jgi:hypothetical protein
MMIPNMLRKDALIATEPGIQEMEFVKLAEDRGMCSLLNLQEYVIYAAGPGAWK